MRSGAYAYRDRRVRKRDFRRLWITRINAAARQEGMSYSELMHGLERGRRRGQPQDARRDRGRRSRGLPPICRARPGGRRGLAAATGSTLPGGSRKRPAFFVLPTPTSPQTMTITSPHNERLKLVRKLQQRKHREREDLFVSEGEDLVAAARRPGASRSSC